MILAALLCSLALAQAELTSDVLSSEFIAETNAKATSWTAGKNFDEDTSVSYLQGLLGGILPMNASRFLETKPEVEIDPLGIPESFDARTRWPRCSVIGLVRNQGQCGSCWAVNAAAVITDRICIHSNGNQQTPISSVDLLSCCTTCGGGCQGGWAELSMQYWVSHGLVTGGEYNSRVGCKPYPFAPSQVRPVAPRCDSVCTTPGKIYGQELRRGRSSYHVPSYNVAQIQMDIMTNGPVEAGITVYQDLFNYRSGVYQHTTNQVAGGHYVRLIGWGVERGVPYWLAVNSWGAGWGDRGYFKIHRGNNESGIEKDCFAGIPL